MGQRYAKAKNKEVVTEVEVVLPPSLLLQIPAEIWNEQVGPMLTSDHYRMLWACGDRRVHRLLTKLKVSSMLVTEYRKVVPEFLQIMCERTRRVLTLRGRTEPMASFPSGAVSIDATFVDVNLDTMSFAQWPNIQSLRLVCARSTTHVAKMPLIDILPMLPASLTELSLQDSYLQGYTPAKQGFDPVVVSDLLQQRLPNLVELDIRIYPLEMSSSLGTCVWPPNLTAMTLTLSPTIASQELLIAYPANLAVLRLNLSSTVQFIPIVRASSLPRSAQRLYMDRLEFNYDAPLPPGTIDFSASKVSPIYSNAPFALPKTIELLHPAPLVASKKLEPNVRAMAYFLRYERVKPYDAQMAKWWTMFEDAIMGDGVDEVVIGGGDNRGQQLNMGYVASAFSQPRVDYAFNEGFSAVLVTTGLEELFARIVSRTLKSALTVSSPTIVPHLLTHAKWLSTFQARSEVASGAFVDFALEAFVSPDIKPRLPRLLNHVVLCLGVETCALLKSVVEEHPEFSLPAITSLSLCMDMSHLSSPELGKAIGVLFPNVVKLRFMHFDSSVDSANMRVDVVTNGEPVRQVPNIKAHSTHLEPVLSRMPSLKLLHISPSYSSRGGQFEEKAIDYLAAIPLRIESVVVTINGATSKW
jgi:hypothetical protein